eukprot:TRINITY_DN65316_c0_g1_i1.p1 TRINITY_DN65316_c0_g1~~TRINITY_DN65316_c0_g1_i1.p1  ORF type:complete len:114 (+),score=3.57 TRINITY_DN65316_c0_g1_i1:24-344(+)
MQPVETARNKSTVSVFFLTVLPSLFSHVAYPCRGGGAGAWPRGGKGRSSDSGGETWTGDSGAFKAYGALILSIHGSLRSCVFPADTTPLSACRCPVVVQPVLCPRA